MAATPKRILHLHSSFSLGGKEARATRLMNGMGDGAHHVILSAVPDALGARSAIAPDVTADFPGDAAPPLHGWPAPARYWRLARLMQRFDLALSYNWGSMDGVMAHRLLSGVLRLPPLIHHEDGFNEDEAVRRDTRRNAFRRMALTTARAVVVPSHTLAAVAAEEWGVTGRRLKLIPNGIPAAAYAAPPVPGAIPGFERQPGEVVVGTVAGLRAVKDLTTLVRAVAPLPPSVRLVIVGEGPERGAIGAAAAECGMADRLMMPGFLDRPHRWVGHFDVLALSSLSEQQPIAVLEGMAAGLPVASFAVGDVAAMVGRANAPFIVPRDTTALSRALLMLAGDQALRRRVGADNQAQAQTVYDEGAMVAAYAALYGISIA